jgi:hypothetical protein
MGKQWPPPGYPIVEGFHELTEDWGVTLPEPMARRVDGDMLILWRPGFSVFVNAWGEGMEEASRKQRLRDIKRECDPDGRIVRNADNGEVTLYAYRLLDMTPDGKVETLNAYAITDFGHLQLGISFDDVKDEAKALALVDSIQYAGLPPSAR